MSDRQDETQPRQFIPVQRQPPEPHGGIGVAPAPAHVQTAGLKAVEAALSPVVSKAFPLETHAPQSSTLGKWPHDDTQSLVEFYGDPRNGGWSDKNLTQISPPWRMYLSWDTAHTIPHFAIHRKCLASLQEIFNAIWIWAEQSQDVVERHHLHLWGGAYNYRPIRGSSRLSCHAFGAAIDIAPDTNGMNTHHLSNMPPEVVQMFKARGWYWGGDFHSRQDPMHFQAAHE